ncbi:MAG: hypothetical protein V4539_17775 [Bacteroidota bacterium]
MRNIHLYKIAGALIVVVAMMGSCKKDYITGGTVNDVNAYANTSTYDALKAAPNFDTLIILIDSAGIKNKINAPGTTFFAPNNSAILNYMSTRTNALQVTNRSAKFGLDSLIYYLKNNIKGTADSLGMYLVSQALPYTILTNAGTKYPTQLAGDTAIVSFEIAAISDPTKSTVYGYTPLASSQPQVVYFTQLWQPYNLSDANPANKVPAKVGIHTICTTSCIKTQNGYLNALAYGHNLFFSFTK